MILFERGERPRLDADALGLTAEQREALRADREILVLAGAGSGKTLTLAARYVGLLLDEADEAIEQGRRPELDAVLVLTFTEKAAAEMAARCQRTLRELVAEMNLPETRSRADQARGLGYGRRLGFALTALLERFEFSRIGTFHGFCARLLGEHATETGLAPGFRVLDEAEARLLRDEVVDATLRAAYAEIPERAARLVAALGGHAATVEALSQALTWRELLGATLRRHAEGEVNLPDLLQLFPVKPDDALAWLETTAAFVFSEILEAIAGSGGGTWVSDTARPALAQVQALLDDPEPDALDVYRVYQDALAAFCTADGRKVRDLTHASVIGTHETWRTVGPSHRLDARRRLEALEGELHDTPRRLAQARGLPTRVDQEMLGALEVLGELFLLARTRYEDALRADECLDFAGLQQHAIDAVERNPALVAALARRHRWLMVDEFQDTDLGQWRLLRRIGRPDGVPADRLFLVGDPKQAIYRFRGGDVTVVDTASRELGVEPLVFSVNFRSRPRLIRWFNQFFPVALGRPGPDRAPWEAPYQPLRAHVAEGPASVTIGLVPADRADEQAEAVARLLAARVLGPTGLQPTSGEPGRGPEVAVLLRNRNRLDLYESALRRYGIRFLTGRGVGFWARPEVRAPVLLLRAIALDDPLAWAGVLRSAWFRLTDQDLTDLVEGRWGLPPAESGPRGPGPRGSGQRALAAFGTYPLDDLAPPRLLLASARAAWARAARATTPPATILREAASSWAVAFDDVLAAGDAGRANLERLLDLVRVRQAREGGDLLAIAEHFYAQILDEPQEAEAPLDAGDAQVVILTVHAAKGLEFPVVVVPECGDRSGQRQRTLVFGRLAHRPEWHVACRALDPDQDLRARENPGFAGLLTAQTHLEEVAESRRLLYVAVTRARDHLFMIGCPRSPESRATQPSWMDWLAEAHGVQGPEGQRLLVPGGADAGLEPDVQPPVVIEDAATWLDAAPPAPLHVEAPVPPPLDEAYAWRLTLPEPIWQISPSGLDALVSDPGAWYREAVLGARPYGSAGATGATLAAVRGRVIHEVLEDDLAGDSAVTLARWRARARAEGVDETRITDGEPDLLRHLGLAANDPRVAARLAAAGMAEVRFRQRVGSIELVGQIDRLWLDRDAGGWVVLDWKSDRLDREGGRAEIAAAAARHTRQLLAYAWAADRVLRAQSQPGIVRLELYFTDIGELWTWGPVLPADLDQVTAALADAARVRAGTLDDVAAHPVAWPVRAGWAPWGEAPAPAELPAPPPAELAPAAAPPDEEVEVAPPAPPPLPAVSAAPGPSRWGSLKRFLSGADAAPSPVPARPARPPRAAVGPPVVPEPDIPTPGDDLDHSAPSGPEPVDKIEPGGPPDPGPPPSWIDAPPPEHAPPDPRAPDPAPPPPRPAVGRRKRQEPAPTSQLSLFGPRPD